MNASRTGTNLQRWLETGSLFLLLAVVILRPLVAESYDSSGNSITAALSAINDPSPLRTLGFDLIILLATSGWLIARAMGSFPSYRRTGLEWGSGLVMLACLVSCWTAGNKRLAVNGSIDWLCYPVLTIALAQLLTSRWRRRLLLAAVLASACAQAAQCVEQHVGFEETWKHYQSIKPTFWAQQGVALDDARVQLFERRIQAHEANGFLPLSNVAGSYLVLCALAALGMAIASWKGCRRAVDRLRAVPALLITVGLIYATVLTGSLGAMIAGVAGLVLWLLLHAGRRWIDVHRPRALLIGWLIVAAGTTGVVGYGLYKKALPGVSLTFRWQYWRASTAMVRDHLWTGVGRENFGRRYLQYKSIESPDEVATPHNLFVQSAVDWGLPGLIGVLIMLVGASVAVSRPVAQQPRAGPSPSWPPSRQRTAAWVVLLGLVILLGRRPLLGTDDPNFLYYSTVSTTLYWLVGFVCFWVGPGKTSFSGNDLTETGDSFVQPGPRGRGKAALRQPAARYGETTTAPNPKSRGNGFDEGPMLTGTAVGIFSFLLHDMISFATFVPGTATTLFALLALCVAGRSGDKSPGQTKSQPGRWELPGMVAMAIVVVVIIAVVPVARARHQMFLARQSPLDPRAVSVSGQPAYHHFLRAAEADPLDPTPFADQAQWLIRASRNARFRAEALEQACESMDYAIKRDPWSLKLRRMKVRLEQQIAAQQHKRSKHAAAIIAARQALKVYPQDPKGLVILADCQLAAGQSLHSEESIRLALDNYHRALILDDRRLAWETLRRLGKRQRREIASKIEQAQRLLQEQQPSSANPGP